MTGITRRTLLTGSLALGVLLAGCAPIAAPRLLMAAGEPGGMYFRFGGLLRDALGRRGPVLTVRETGGSGENLALLRRGSADLAIALADSVLPDDRGLVAIGRVYQNYLHCVAATHGPMRTTADLAGRRISVGAPGSGAASTARTLLRGLGLAERVEALELPLSEAAQALAAGTIDAFFWSGGIPTPQIDDLAGTTPLRLLDLADALPVLQAAHPGAYASATIPPGVYGVARETRTVGIPNLLLARPELDDAVVGALVDTLVEDTRSLVPAGSVGIQFLTPSNLIDTAPVPLHPAATRRYRHRYG